MEVLVYISGIVHFEIIFISKLYHFAVVVSMGRESWTSIEKFVRPITNEETPPKILSSCSQGLKKFSWNREWLVTKNAEFYAGFKNTNLP
jgi:hypothetical protein